MANIIEMTDVTWKREDKTLLHQVNWQVAKGEHWAILGLNGSGKTTLLNMLNGYIWPTSGKISVLGEVYGSVDLREQRKSIGWVSSSLQEKLYGQDKTQFVVISGKYASIGMYEIPTEGDLEKAFVLMNQLGCSHLIDRTYQSCSQGEKQKLLIARALMASPQLLILDEACNGLDFLSKESLLRSIEQLAAEPNAPNMLYVTHHTEEILPMFTHTLLIRRGEIYMQGKTPDVLNTSCLSAFFETPVHVDWHHERAWLSTI
ncbi:ABC transporter ATP-binding protein [Paenibacillus eucommiae]|uniref:Iron complex transport system ATP-binding protein n=1 Tax=Paenibacillus eucommiae TaxID=1355755 RepID=A0ABS4JAP0_9BACL|nr:ABC transporter ATP-binding protein [Paenibacillus eucommiae]MBP1996912.1 iron complex transport system ATP-binding protein [Paenibacillus eucommiae]